MHFSVDKTLRGCSASPPETLDAPPATSRFRFNARLTSRVLGFRQANDPFSHRSAPFYFAVMPMVDVGCNAIFDLGQETRTASQVTNT